VHGVRRLTAIATLIVPAAGRRLTLLALVTAAALYAMPMLNLGAQGQAPGGFVELMTSTVARAQPTAAQIAQFVPTTRGRFFFPAPYNTEGFRITVPSDCNGTDCIQQEGYSFWRNINAHAGQPVVRMFLVLQDNGGPQLFTIDKATGAVTRVGPIFTSGPLAGNRGTGWQWSATNPDILYAYGTSQVVAKNVATGAETVVLDLASPGAQAAHGSGPNVRVWSALTSNDGLSWVMTVRQTTSPWDDIGCAIHHIPTNAWHFVAGLGDCFVDKGGTYWIKTSIANDLRKGTVNPWSIGEALSDQNGAPGHLDVGWGFFIGEDNWAPLGQSLRIWDLSLPFASAGQGRTVHTMTSWLQDSYVQPTWAMGAPATLATVGPQVACNTSTSGQAGSTVAREREILCFQMDASMRALIVAPNMTSMSAAGGGIPYYKAPKGNMDVYGQYYFWITNMGGNRLEAFAVRLPLHLLTGGGSGDTTPPVVSVTAPANGATVSGNVTVSATATDNVGVLNVQLLLDGANLGPEIFTAPYSIGWNSLTVPNGTHTLAARARDAAGNITTSAAVTVTVQNVVDTTPPTVSLTAPANGATVSGTLNVDATASDNIGVVGVQFLLDGANLGLEDTTSPYSVSWNSVMTSNGAHTLTARARDASGNTTLSAARSVTVSNTVPPPTGLVAAYGYSENSGTLAADASPSGNTATLTSPAWAVGQFGSALFPNGAAYAESPDLAALTPGATATFEAWVYLTSAPTELASIVNKWGQTADDEYLFGLTTGRNPYFAWHTTGGSTWGTPAFNDTVDPSQVPLNTWTHLALVRNGATLTFYLNGVASSSVSVMDGNPFRNGTHSLRVGSQNRGGMTRAFPGRVDELRIYTSALTIPQIQADIATPINTGGDTTPPTVSLTAPANGATLSGMVNVDSTASDNVGVVGVQIRIDGMNVGAEDTTSPYSLLWNTATATNGSHVIVSVARDAAGNTTTSAAITVTVQNTLPDNTPPTVSITAPANGATVTGTVSVTANASDNVGVAGVQFRLDGVNLGAEDTSSPYAVSWNTASASIGTHTLSAVARDAAGNTTTSATITVVVPDTTSPTVSISAPANGASVSGTISVTAVASDNVGVAGVQFLLDGVNLGAEDTASPYAVSWNTAAASVGSHTLTARARDAAGNTTISAAITVTVLDQTAPTVSVTAPANGATVTGTVSVTATASDNVGVAGVQFLLDGANLGAEDTTAPYSVSWNTATATPGSHVVTARARDAAGNATTSATVTLTVPDTTAPTVSVTAPANGATVTGTVPVSANASDNVGVVGVQFLLDGANLGAEDTTAPYSVSWNAATASIGSHTLTAQARDAAGNTTTSAAITVTVPDILAPTASITAPANGATVTGTVSVTANASDNVGVVGVQFLLDGVNLGAEDTSSPYAASWNTATATAGSHTLTARARDAAGNTTTSSTITVTVPDTTAPTVSVTAPANGATVTGTVSVTASASDNVGVVGVQFLLDGANLGAEDTASPYSVSWNTATATPGSHVLTARARDAAGNTTTSATITVTVPDTSAPTVSVTAPANGATVTGTVSVTASASDNVGVAGVQFRLDGVNLGAEDTTAPYSVSWNTATAALGAHTLTAVARDAAGNTTTSAAITVTVPDTTAPAVSLTAPANGTTVTGTVSVTASASDNVGVAGVQFLLDGANLGAEDTTAPYAVNWNTATASIGTHTLAAIARDAAGNTATSTTITVTVPDTSVPTVAITAPANGATVTGTVSVTASASDNVGVVGVQFLLNGVNLGAEDTSSPYAVSWDTTSVSAGSHALTARARDAAGNTTTSSTITVTIPDATAPTVSVTAPANGATVTGTVSVTASASDNVGVVGVQFLLDGANLGAEDTTAPYSVSWNAAAATAGAHTLQARARDAAGNTTTSATITVTVPDTSAPTVSITAPANGATVTGTVSVTASASDNVGVAGVQFRLDGVNLGAEDTTAPYSVSWNTTSATAGTHTLAAVARDAAGNTTTSSTITVTVPDTTAPAVSLTAPANGATVTGTVSVTANASDDVSVAGVQFLLDGVNLGAEDTSSPYSVSWNTATATPGAHTLTARARDAAGNTTTSTPVSVTVSDTSAPTVSILAPANGATVSGVIAVTASAADNAGIAGVQFLLNGANLGAEDTTSPFSVNWSTTTVSNGSHTLTAVARDTSGNTTTSAAVVVTVQNSDTTPPTVSMTAPAGGATVSGTVTLSATASDNIGVVGVQFRLDGVDVGAEDTNAPYNRNWDTTTVANGSHTLTAVARDAAGNTTISAAVVVTVSNADTTFPTVSLTAPANGATVTGTVTVSANASDNVGVAGVQFRLDGANLGAEDTTAPYSIDWNTATATVGAHTLAAVARDAAGNTTTSTVITVTVPDTTAPAVSVSAPANGATVSGQVTVSANASDNVGVAGVQFLLDGANLGAEDTSSPYSVSWNAAAAAPGAHTLAAVARDAAGNTTTSTVITVTVADTSGPTVSIIAPVDGAIVSGVIAVTAATSDNVGVAGVQFLLDGVNLGAEDTSSPYSVNWNTATATLGPHTLTAVARDGAGNTTTSAPIIVTVPDVSAPTVAVTAPANGATVTGTVTVSAAASDNVNIAGVQFLLDGVNLGAEDTTAPYSVSWNTATAALGAHTLTAVARDTAGNTTTSAAITVTVPDTTAPAVAVTAPANGANVGGIVTVSATASDNVGVAGVQFLLDGANLGAEDTTAPFSIDWNSATATVGSHTLAAVARDAAGNTTTSVIITVTVTDASSPTVAITAPANGATVSGQVTVSANASDNVGVAGVQFLLDGVNLGAEDTTAPYSVSWNTATAVPGGHALTAVARDAAGNTTTSTVVTVSVADTSAPTVAITAPADGAIVSGVISVAATTSDNVGVAGVQFRLDGVNLGAEDTTAPYSVSWNTATAALGAHTLTAVARDAAGNTTTSAPIIVTVPDLSAPAVALTAPANGATVTGTVAVSANASDNVGVAGVQFLLDGANLGAEDTTAPYSVSWNTAAATLGTHTLTAVARDAAGNTTTAATITVTVPDTTAPAVAVTAPANGATVGGMVTVSATASDNVGVAGVQFRLDGANFGAEDTTAPYSIDWNSATATVGSHTLAAVARDAAGNTTTSVIITVTVTDASSPTVAITAPANGATVSSVVSVTATASDNVGVAGVQFLLDGVNLGAEDTTAPYSVSWNTATIANGSHTLTAVARDAAGNATTSTAVTVTVSNADLTLPTVSLTEPANGATVGGTVTISADASDNVGVAGVQFRLDGVNLGAEVTSSPFSFSWNSTGVANGTHTLTAVARDAAGNTATSAAVTVSVSNATATPAGLMAAYGYNEGGGTSAFDASPTGGVATLTGATWAAGWFGSTLSTAAGGYAESADVDPLTPGVVATFSAWVFVSSAPTEIASIINKWSGSPDDEYLFGLTANRNLYFSWHTTGGSTWGTPAYGEVASADNVPLNVWTHVAVVRNFATVSFYVNGVLSSSSSPLDANPFRNGVNSLRVGGQNRGGVIRQFPGRVDEMRIYTRALTAIEIQNDLNTPIGGAGDTTPPEVVMTAPPNGAIVSGTFIIGADASDNVSVFGVRFRVNGINMGAEDLNAPYTTTFVTAALPNGTHTLTAVARDAAGNITTSEPVTVTVQNIAPDTVPPAVSLTAPANGATVSGTVTVSATASDNVGVVGVQFKLDGVTLGVEDTASPFSTSWITAIVADGVHTITAVARDAAGNTTTSAPRSVTVSNGAVIAGLVTAYAFDEGTGRSPADSSPIGNGGTLMGGASWAPGRFGSALATNGTGYAEAPDVQPLTPGTAATFEAWVYLTSPPDGLVSVINKWSQSADDEYLFGLTSNRSLHFAWRTTGPGAWGSTSYNETTAGSGQLPVGAWTHVAVVRTGTTLTFYINGDVVGTASVMDTNPFRDGRHTLRIGGQGRGTVSSSFPGLVDEVRIYNRALTQAEIQQDMNTPIGAGGGGLQ
jgi:hypothetical protein